MRERSNYRIHGGLRGERPKQSRHEFTFVASQFGCHRQRVRGAVHFGAPPLARPIRKPLNHLRLIYPPKRITPQEYACYNRAPPAQSVESLESLKWAAAFVLRSRVLAGILISSGADGIFLSQVPFLFVRGIFECYTLSSCSSLGH